MGDFMTVARILKSHRWGLVRGLVRHSHELRRQVSLADMHLVRKEKASPMQAKTFKH